MPHVVVVVLLFLLSRTHLRACCVCAECMHAIVLTSSGGSGTPAKTKEAHTLRKQKEFGGWCSPDIDQMQRKPAATDLTLSLGRCGRSHNKIVTF